MKMRKSLSLAALLLTALAAPAVQAAPSVVGDWYEDMKQLGERTISLLHLKKDGSYRVEFRVCRREGVRDSSHIGRWTYEDGRLILIADIIDNTPAFMKTEYQTQSLDHRIWDYRYIGGTPIDFHDVRVTADSKMPACDLSS